MEMLHYSWQLCTSVSGCRGTNSPEIVACI